ncbi:MAG: efflux RND transporter periplasmic adaptor subunit, partial [Paraprevotella sp.]|nr:efflux RND transporter periplasmic adaptor subunit [Paraprevotella sp.]
MKKKKIIIAAVIVIIAVIIAVIVWPKESSPVQFETTEVAPDTLRSSVTATGTIEPVTEVEVGTQVSGIISKIYVDYNSVVKKGEVIAELDKTTLNSELNSAKANLASAKSELDYQQTNYNRYKKLQEKGLISSNDYETAYLNYRKALETYNTNKESVKKAETNLEYATITSPIDGIVLSREVEEGQTVAASFETPTLFTIAKDLTDMRVIANIDEADIGNVREGQNVTFTVDAYPNDTFLGQVTQVRLEATGTDNVITYEVVISAPNNDLKLKPGLTANVSVNTLERTGVLSVKAKALRFLPTKETVGKSYKIVDTNGKNKLWTLEGNVLTAHSVKIGDTDGVRTEILGGISKGTKVILSMSEITENESDSQEDSSPFLPQPK